MEWQYVKSIMEMKNSFVREGKRSEFGIDEWKLYFGENELRMEEEKNENGDVMRRGR